MKHLLAWGLLALIGVVAVEPANAQSGSSATKYWIFFEDRGADEAVFRFSATSEALERRARRGRSAPSSIDHHVSPRYVAFLRELGIEPIVESRWLNAVSATLSAAQYTVVSDLDIVKGLRPVSRLDESRSPRLTEGVGFPIPATRGPLALDYGDSEMQLALVNAIPPLEAGINGTGVRLGFLDASFAGLDHPSLLHITSEERARIEDFTGQVQGGSHGLSVVSVAAGYAPGELIGPGHGAYILAATTEYIHSETNAEEDFFVAGLEWLEGMGADVVSASIGYTTFDPGQRNYTQADLDGETGITTVAADMAASLGITFVAAAGNYGRCSPPSESCWHYIGTPADGHFVIAVGAVTSSGTRSTFSSFGPTADGRIKPDVAAMGTSVFLATPDGEYAHSQGTSFSAPMVAGIVTQMLQVNPSLTPVEVADILRQTASQSKKPDNALGWGIVNAEAAVQIAVALGADERPEMESFRVTAYPNPATDYLFIHINARSMHLPDFRLYDVLGRAVDLQKVDLRQPSRDVISLATSSLRPGVYFYTIEADNVRASGKFVVVR